MNLTLSLPSLMAATAPVAAKAFSAGVDRAQNVVQGNDQGLADLGTANSLINYLSGVSAENTAKSQEFAREQMAFQRESQLATMAYNAQEAAKNRDWQELMSNTAHQREMADLQAAGLNPVLAANGGASVGSGSSASVSSLGGSSGSVDTSLSGAAAGLVGSVFNSLAALRNQEVSAKTAVDIAKIQSDTSKVLGALQAETGRYAADQSLRGTAYSADQHLRGTYYSSDSSRAAVLGSASLSANAVLNQALISSASARAVADINNAASMERLETSNMHDVYMSKYFPKTLAGFAGSFSGNMSDLVSGIASGISGSLPSVGDSLKHILKSYTGGKAHS